MKWIVILAICFYSCKKCADCTRTWTYEQYIIIDSTGEKQIISHPTKKSDPVFESCEVDNEDAKTKHSHEYVGQNPHGSIYIDGTGTCICIAK